MVHPKVPKEIKKMEEEGNPDIGILYRSPSLENFILFVRGPKDTAFEGAFFKIHCHLTSNYPFNPPVMCFMTKVWHPNVSSVTGAICLDILKDKWTPAMNISIALLSIQALLTAAEPDDPQDWEVAEMYKKNPKEYEAKAREWVRLYAQEGMITDKEEMVLLFLWE
ncbi:ubiquitin-conjugating enzyme family protein [Blastocystis sp. subtype 4]|uniref:ubiquitin-conjugating enzyme family protein n=1 Tax=Blastocystis sp. subtype 4 TaxID=944170 RepID=UPI00071210B2|nr:ubiquitin-conjugating enzyme family protein [Blastocystis sp. subtype 4]KNB46232.1 ubiquitin-conjugating enzyme family protein [Blastocystis sp. subtype 4]|eukprot:XP_014529674.1 ubiquitin-conjugating enzyme family protein [Blastocystis sp. subtype 4]